MIPEVQATIGKPSLNKNLDLKGRKRRASRSRRDTIYVRHVKRCLDFVGALVSLLLTFPFLLVCAVAVRLDSRGSVFFRQWRVGLQGKRFQIIKFRTMVDDANRKGLKLTSSQDSRITRVGKLFRKMKIDEVPQLFNVLRGEMSLVGPRPEVPEYVATYTQDQERVLERQPGITGPASIAFIDEDKILANQPDAENFYIKTLLQRKIGLDLAYCRKVSFIEDVKLILLTLAVLFKLHRPNRTEINQ